MPISLLLASALVTGSTAAGQPPRAQPITPLETLVSPDDYPREAQFKGQEGGVRVLIRVDEKGAVSDCVIEQSSGFAALDTQTCRLIWQRAKFKPVTDSHGKPVASELHKRFVWRLERDPSPNQAWAVRRIVSIASGRPPECRIEVEGALPKTPAKTDCPETGSANLAAALGASSSGIIEFVEEQKFAPDVEPTLSAGSGDNLIGSVLAQLEISAAGKLVSCKIAESHGVIPPSFPDLCSLVPKEYQPRSRAGAAPSAFTAYYLTGAYLHVLKVA